MTFKIFVTQGAFYSSIISRVKKFGKVVDSPNDANFIVFSGGEDISPKIYGEDNTYSYFNPGRDEFEINVYKIGVKNNAKMLGICRGHQLILALNGAKLVQDIGIELGWGHPSHHYIETILPDVIPEFVNSLHHQGIKIGNVPDNFKIIGCEPNTQIIEATISKNHQIMTVQFHPEIMDTKIFDVIVQHLLEEKCVLL